MHYNAQQHTVTHCNALQHKMAQEAQQHSVTHCNELQHTLTHCNTLQHTATHCNTLQKKLAQEAQHVMDKQDKDRHDATQKRNAALRAKEARGT